MRNTDKCNEVRPIVETLEGRALASISPLLAGTGTFRTHTTLTVDAGALGEPITFNATMFAKTESPGPLDLYYRGKLFQEVPPTGVVYSTVQVETEATYTIPAGIAAASLFGVGPHAVRVRTPEWSTAAFESTYLPSTAVAVFRVTRPQFVTQPSGIGIATVSAGSGPALQPGQTATVQYDAYLAASFRLFYSTGSQTPGTQSFTVDANPEQVIPGLDVGVVGMQLGETRAIYIPHSLARGVHGNFPVVQRRANLVYLVTLVSIT
jgi:hypothetical protein